MMGYIKNLFLSPALFTLMLVALVLIAVVVIDAGAPVNWFYIVGMAILSLIVGSLIALPLMKSKNTTRSLWALVPAIGLMIVLVAVFLTLSKFNLFWFAVLAATCFVLAAGYTFFVKMLVPGQFARVVDAGADNGSSFTNPVEDVDAEQSFFAALCRFFDPTDALIHARRKLPNLRCSLLRHPA